jgi:hypothetical protein
VEKWDWMNMLENSQPAKLIVLDSLSYRRHPQDFSLTMTPGHRAHGMQRQEEWLVGRKQANTRSLYLDTPHRNLALSLLLPQTAIELHSSPAQWRRPTNLVKRAMHLG